MVIFPPLCFVLIYGPAFLILTCIGISVTKIIKGKTESHIVLIICIIYFRMGTSAVRITFKIQTCGQHFLSLFNIIYMVVSLSEDYHITQSVPIK